MKLIEKHNRLVLLGVLLLLLAVAARSAWRDASTARTFSAPAKPQLQSRFKTPWQNESEFFLESIVSDIARMAVFAKSQSLQTANQCDVRAIDISDPVSNKPIYRIEITLDRSQPTLNVDLPINGPIWSPAIYSEAVNSIFKRLGTTIPHRGALSAENNKLVFELAELNARTIEQANLRVSKNLAHRFFDPTLHEDAALILGAFMLRDSSGDFFDLRTPLCRMTAHLAMAAVLADGSRPGNNGQLAEALLFTLMNNQKAALEKLSKLDGTDSGMQPWIRALQTRNTHDYRALAKMQNASRLEKLECFRAQCCSADSDSAWRHLNDRDKQSTVDYSRIVQASAFSVESGHELLALSLPLELSELNEVYRLAYGKNVPEQKLMAILNVLPMRSFIASDTNQPQIIDWGQWANFAQRHICHALEQNYKFIRFLWSVPDAAAEFATHTDDVFSGLTLYPFVSRLNNTSTTNYPRAMDACFALTVETPHLIPLQAWSMLYIRGVNAPEYRPAVSPQIEQWLKSDLPMGTAYDSKPRVQHPRQRWYTDMVSRIQKLHELAPFDNPISGELLRIKYPAGATKAQMEEAYGSMLEYDANQIVRMAEKSTGQPKEYEKLMNRAASINPAKYYKLAEYFANHHADDTAAGYYEKAIKLCPDAVRAANHSDWLTRYYQRKGMTDRALALADEAADVYSSSGLQTKADLLESLGRYSEAFQIYKAMEERYGPQAEFIGFLTRNKEKVGAGSFDKEIEVRMSALFPKGFEKVSLQDFSQPPKDGVIIKEENELIRNAGLKPGNVIVAVFGLRVHNFEQYTYGRETSRAPEMLLIVWKSGQYSEVKVNLPQRRFGVQMTTYASR